MGYTLTQPDRYRGAPIRVLPVWETICEKARYLSELSDGTDWAPKANSTSDVLARHVQNHPTRANRSESVFFSARPTDGIPSGALGQPQSQRGEPVETRLAGKSVRPTRRTTRDTRDRFTDQPSLETCESTVKFCNQPDDLLLLQSSGQDPSPAIDTPHVQSLHYMDMSRDETILSPAFSNLAAHAESLNEIAFQTSSHLPLQMDDCGNITNSRIIIEDSGGIQDPRSTKSTLLPDQNMEQFETYPVPNEGESGRQLFASHVTNYQQVVGLAQSEITSGLSPLSRCPDEDVPHSHIGNTEFPLNDYNPSGEIAVGDETYDMRLFEWYSSGVSSPFHGMHFDIGQPETPKMNLSGERLNRIRRFWSQTSMDSSFRLIKSLWKDVAQHAADGLFSEPAKAYPVFRQTQNASRLGISQESRDRLKQYSEEIQLGLAGRHTFDTDISRSASLMQGQSDSSYSTDSQMQFPSREMLGMSLEFFFRHFHHLVPFIHQPTFDAKSTPSLLLFPMCLIGLSILDPRGSKDLIEQCRMVCSNS